MRGLVGKLTEDQLLEQICLTRLGAEIYISFYGQCHSGRTWMIAGAFAFLPIPFLLRSSGSWQGFSPPAAKMAYRVGKCTLRELSQTAPYGSNSTPRATRRVWWSSIFYGVPLKWEIVTSSSRKMIQGRLQVRCSLDIAWKPFSYAIFRACNVIMTYAMCKSSCEI